MRTTSSLYAAFIGLAFVLACSLSTHAQCNLSQGCKPADNLTGKPNGTGQVFVGDGASNDGAGGWTTAYAGSNQCLSCHNDGTITTYLMSGHKNTLRKLAPGVLWAGPDGNSYSTNDDHYGSGSTYDWTNNLVTLGWCDPLWVPGLNGLPAHDPTCTYPFYTQSNTYSPAPYTPVAPTTSAGGVQNLFYIFGGWEKYGGAANPAATHVGTIFSNGFTGGLYPNGTFGCARCHATGYNFDASAPEPTQNTNNAISPIPDAQFSRIPSDGFVAPGTQGTSSWYLTGVQCERCHQAAWSYGNHGSGPWQATMPQYEAATALCLECHRGENVTMANSHTVPPTQGSITPQATPKVIDHGYCSDQSGSTYAACVANPGNTWVYKPSFQHEAGPTFLNSPHARFTGSLIQNAQHSPDLSITLTGSYQSLFSDNPIDPSKNNGCTGCHDPHQSVSPSSKIPAPYVCNDCHNLSNSVPQTVNHPTGPGTPFPTGTSADVPGSCVICHMVAADGQVKSHLFRVNDSASYSTFPTPDQLYNQNITSPNVGSDGVINSAAWNDIDLVCGQCHIGGNGSVNPYGLTPPAASARAPHLSKSTLAGWLASSWTEGTSGIHSSDTPAPMPQFTPASGGPYYTPQTVTISESAPYLTIYYNTDGRTPPNSTSIEYSPGTPILVNGNTSIKATAVGVGGWISGSLATATYTFRTAAPVISPAGANYTTAISVSLTDVTPNVTYYYTLDGTTPTTNSTLYTGPVTLSASATFSAIAVSSYGTSTLSSASYTIVLPQAATPTFSPSPAVNYSGPQSVTISDTTPNAKIYYTVDGSTPTTSSTLYSGAISVNATTTIKAIAVATGYRNSLVGTATYNLVAARPTMSPSAGTFTTPQSVTLSDATAGVSIYYTLDGSTPTTSSTLYTGVAIPVSTTTTINAIAAGNGYGASPVATGTYKIVAAIPAFSPSGGTFTAPQSVTLSDATPGVSIYYTLDGSTPTTSSTLYTGVAIPVSTTTTIKAIAAGNGYAASGVGTATYNLVAARPTLSPSAGTFTTPQSVTLSDATPGVSIYYTLDGSTPTTSSTLYTGAAIPVSTTTTISAIAAGNGYGASGVASGTYRIVASIPTFSPSGGTFSAPQSVTLSDASPGVSIYYTLDGSTPTTSSTLYTGVAVSVSTTTTIKAIAAGNGYAASGVGSATYTINGLTPALVNGQPLTIAMTNSGTDTGSSGNGYAPSTVASGTYNLVASTPVLSPAAQGSFTAPISVALTDATPGAAVYYTTDGSTPTTGAALYAGPIPVSSTTTIKAIAAGKDLGASAVVTGTYVFVAAAPVFSPAPGGTFRAPLSVTLTDATPGVTIYYTTDGSIPTASSTPYTKPIRITASATIKAIAVGNGYSASPIAGASYGQTWRPAQRRKVVRASAPKLDMVTRK